MSADIVGRIEPETPEMIRIHKEVPTFPVNHIDRVSC